MLGAVALERWRQESRWGEQNHPDGTGAPLNRRLADYARESCEAAFSQGRGTWAHILMEEYREVLAEADTTALREELVQLAAVAVAWVEAIDRRAS